MTVSPPHVTVLIPVHNGAQFVADAIESALGQTYADSDVIVIDDGSTDGTPEVLASFGDRITVLEQRNLGASTARNNAIDAASGPLVALLDADDVWRPSKLEKQVAAWSSGEDIGLVLCGYDVVTRDLNEVLYRVPLEDARRRINDAAVLDAWGVGLSFTAVFPKQVVEDVGGFQANLSIGADLEFAVRVAGRYAVAEVSECLALYRSHPDQMHRDASVFERDMYSIFEGVGQAGLGGVSSLRARGQANLHVRRAITEVRAGRPATATRHAREVLRQRPSRLLLAPAEATLRRLRYRMLARRA